MYSCKACRLAAMVVCWRIGFGVFCVLLFLFSFTTFKNMLLLLRQVACLFVATGVALCKCAGCDGGKVGWERVIKRDC